MPAEHEGGDLREGVEIYYHMLGLEKGGGFGGGKGSVLGMRREHRMLGEDKGRLILFLV